MNLSSRGQLQASALADYLRHKRFNAIYASPMKRVQQTLAPLLNKGVPAPVVMPGLREVDFGDWTGHGWEAVFKLFGVRAYDWLEHLQNGTVPNGDSAATFRERVEPCVQQILSRHDGQTVAVFCHGGVIRMILSILLDLPLPSTNSFEIEYASVTEVLRQPHRSEIRLLNFTPWRDLVSNDTLQS